MKMSRALEVIAGNKGSRRGYCVSFEVRDHGLLKSDHFPDVHAGEAGIANEEEAWRLAVLFAVAKHEHEVVNVTVLRASDFSRVSRRALNEYPEGA